MTRAWFTTIPTDTVPPVAVPVNQARVVQSSVGAGIVIPPRLSDCSGVRPSWYPFQINVCDFDDPDPLPLTARQMTI